jgi:hypothetical protein
VFARQTLGDEVQIELWYLAEHLLLAWHDWHGLSERFPRYFGEPTQPFPAVWRRLDADCTVLADQLLITTFVVTRSRSSAGFFLPIAGTQAMPSSSAKRSCRSAG